MIREKSFKSQMRGYNVDEVDDFLDYVMVEVERLLEENANQRKQIDELVKKLKQGGGEGADPAEVESLRRQLEAARMRITALEKTPAPATAAAPSPDPALLKQLEEAKLRIRELEAKCCLLYTSLAMGRTRCSCWPLAPSLILDGRSGSPTSHIVSIPSTAPCLA